MTSSILCIHHANCADGFASAWVVRKLLGPEVEFVAAKYGEPPPFVQRCNMSPEEDGRQLEQA